jgi:hypothetical protein
VTGLEASLARASERTRPRWPTADDGCKLPAAELAAALAEREARILAQEAALSDARRRR